jgi:hypothetical protein
MFFSSKRAKVALGYDPRPPRAAFEDAIDWFREKGYAA